MVSVIKEWKGGQGRWSDVKFENQRKYGSWSSGILIIHALRILQGLWTAFESGKKPLEGIEYQFECFAGNRLWKGRWMQRNHLGGNDGLDQGGKMEVVRTGKKCPWIHLASNSFIKTNTSEQVQESSRMFCAREVTNRTKSIPAFSNRGRYVNMILMSCMITEFNTKARVITLA